VNSTPTSRMLVARRPDRTSQRIARAVELAAIVVALAAPLHAQITPGTTPTKRFETGIVIGGDWLQANALPLERDAMHSVDFSVSLRRQTWAVDGGWLRIARDLSTVQGVYFSAGPLLHLGPVLFIPAVGVLGGQAQESRDSTGFDFVVSPGVIGHTPRYSYSSSATGGGSVGITVEVPVYRMIGFRAVASEWLFAGAPVAGDRSRTVVGAGLSLRVR
jgi:hypothetical protein